MDEAKTSIVEEFMKGAKKGFYIGVELIAPAMVMAYALIEFLKISGAMEIIGNLLNPVMGVFGLPGAASVALIAAFFSKAAGCAAAATLFGDGKIDAAQATMLLPACVTMGTLVGHFARIVLVTNANKLFYPVLFLTPIIDAIIVLYLTRLVIMFF
ncbi:MAG TPA: nucleoside recognition protein [Candidatus Avacidaminococcus intestinavium]|uniref:Nucleoside recognition protein n=1 Tax=Candidatus Avacidaminococcus intestinavium TaxID=2840684 RepID=A0A9D1MPR1_9FIRM|nr:nucleoside recognition protein [Candidatus Avacidaminococcus intestinavium]